MIPLSRNRNYQVLWGSQALAELGFSASVLAFPLLVLAVTQSPVAAGLVMGIDSAAQLLAGLPAGALADRWDRKRLMLCCEAAQALAVAALVVALWLGVADVPLMAGVAAVMGTCRALFEPAEEASLPRVVPAEQLGQAVALNSARGYFGQMTGNALGGVLYGIRAWLPFALDAVTHTLAFVGLLFLKMPKQERARAPLRELHLEIAAGLRWLVRQPLLRVIALCAVSLNFFFYAYYLVVVALARQRGVPEFEIGLMASVLGVGGMLGALLAPWLHKVLSPYLSIISVFWALVALTPLALVLHNGYLLGALFCGMSLLTPTANTTIMTYQLLLTPDELRGRTAGVMSVVAGIASTAGPAVGGLLVELAGGEVAVLVCTGGIALLAVLATANRTLRRFPRQAEATPLAGFLPQQER
ncbi:MFS transporter [Kutzneria viridogrisea]|uniref:MFS family permease n=1 Tax=Kutzneria viridogrisea TaxID=47990 RepID=A0ABR6BVR5_9PSEU|nr:MFS family permease [Kutzneria viridogrisea]